MIINLSWPISGLLDPSTGPDLSSGNEIRVVAGRRGLPRETASGKT